MASVKAKIKLVHRLTSLSTRCVVYSNKKIFRDVWDTKPTDVAFIQAKDELDAWQKGQAIADEYNERIKTQRQADRDKAKQDKKGKPNNC